MAELEGGPAGPTGDYIKLGAAASSATKGTHAGQEPTSRTGADPTTAAAPSVAAGRPQPTPGATGHAAAPQGRGHSCTQESTEGQFDTPAQGWYLQVRFCGFGIRACSAYYCVEPR